MERAVRAVDGVDSATVTLVPGGASSLSVSGSATPELVGAAVVAAGYTFTQVN
ncbi:heavy-metal-associated domain-containing protein [Arthrobacter sp. BF1]|uniref:heavy-metal-associated domain-containing protein n=1 Tax=Arthrobacter sp. BF1 TaxID=2821145 RepID=UPI00358E45E1